MELSGFDAWGIVSIIAVLLLSLLVANMLKRRIPFLRKSLIPFCYTSQMDLAVQEVIHQSKEGY